LKVEQIFLLSTPDSPLSTTKIMAKLLVVDDEKNLRLVVQKELSRQGHEVETAADGEAAWEALEAQDFDVLLCDINMPRLDGIGLLRRLREKSQNPPEVIMLTGQGTVESAIEAMKLGAYDYLTKPYRITELSALVTQSAEKQQLKIDNQRLRAQLERTHHALPEIVAQSSQMKEVLRLVQRVAPSDTSVLITGESGTGKELIAQAIHRLSRRNNKTFIDLNCAALQDSLLESELFGHEAGAFSGARARKLGLFEIADGGTIFLDEVMEMPAQLQSKLLRALETRTFFRVGGVKKVEVDVRLVAATNRNAKQALAEGTFRSDLLYRINSFEINIPPLRERREDIEPLAQYILQKIGGANAPEITPQAIDALSSFSWSGNVRQLRNCLERAILLADNGRITTKELPPEVVYNTEKTSVSVSYNEPQTNVTNSFQNGSPTALRDVEKQQIINALDKTGWHRGKTAELLGISPSTLYRRLREYDLETR
jgi:DNA-binding NtrC family response regulator